MRIASHRRSRFLVLLATLAVLAAACTPSVPESPGAEGQAQEEGGDGDTLRFVWFTDGPDLEVIEATVADFEEAEGVTVDFLVLPYEDLTQQLQAQIQGGDPPDVVRLADTAEFRQGLLDISQYLEDPEAFAGEFLEPAMPPVTGPEGELYGIPHDFTMNGPIVNLDMFAAADIEVPDADDEPWTWQELVDNARAAQEAAGAPYAIAYDRSGHRFGGMLSQFGGTYFEDSDEDIPGMAFDGEGAQQAVEQFVALHEDGLMPLDVWLGSGSRYAAAADFFVSEQAPVYFAGNWMVAQFEESITDFEWAAMPNPCEDNCGGYPGGKFVVAVEGSQNPELAARMIEYLGQRDVMERYVSEALFLPTRNDLIEQGVPYPVRQDDMAVFLADIPRLPEASYNDAYHPLFGPVAMLTADQITRALAGEAEAGAVLEEVTAEGEQLVEEARG